MSGSGTDYTLTPNLQLFKPIYDHDVEMWGTHLNANADVLDATLSTGAGGVFLPIAGGTMAGNILLPDGGNAISQIAADAWYLQLSGGALGGPLILAADPATGPAGAMQAVTRQYVDNNTLSQTAADARYLQQSAADARYMQQSQTDARYLQLTGGTVSGLGTFQNALTVGTNTASTSAAALAINGAVAQQRRIDFQTAGVGRWRLGAGPGAESGNNAGSDLFLNAYTDAGAAIGAAITVVRSTRQTQLISLQSGGTFAYTGQPASNSMVPLFLSGNFTGSTDHAAWCGLNNVNINSDTLDVGASQQAIGFYWNQNFGGAGITGSRSGARFSLVMTGAAPANANYQGGLFSVDVRNNSGGTDLWANAAGVVFGGGCYANVNNGATFYRGAVAAEFDYGIAASGSAASINGIQVIRWSTHKTSPPVWELDTAITIGSQTGAVGAKIGFMVGQANGDWPMDATNGRLFGAGFTTGFSSTLPMQAAHGIDLYNVNLLGTQFRGRGFSVQGSGGSLQAGAVQVGGGVLSSSGATVSLDTAGSMCTAAAIASGGANLIVGTPLVHDATGTLAVVSAVSAGAATAVTLTANTGFALNSALPANPVTFRVSSSGPLNHPGAPTAPTLNLTWTASTGLSLQPSGGAASFGGPVTVRGTPLVPIQALYASYTLVGNGADTTSDVLQTYTLPANTLKNVGDRLLIKAGGTFAGSTDSKTALLLFGGGVVTSLTVNTAGQLTWRMEAEICKTGANAQTLCGVTMGTNNTVAANTVASSRTDTASIVVTVNGQNSTTATASSITCRYFTVDYINAG